MNNKTVSYESTSSVDNIHNAILEHINSNNWTDAIKLTKNLFYPISSGKNLFHFACMRGNSDVINEYLKLKSHQILLSDDFGNTGAHLLAINQWDDLLLELLNHEPQFLTLKNNDEYFIYDLVIDRKKTFILILEMMKINNYQKYLNYLSKSNISLFIKIVDYYNDSSICNELLLLLKELHYDFTLSLETPALLYALYRNLEKLAIFMIQNLKLDINIKNIFQYTPLIVSLKKNQLNVVSELLKYDELDVNYGGFENQHVPINICFKNNLFNIAYDISEHKNFDFNKKDNLLNTPIYYLLENSGHGSELITKLINKFIVGSNMSNLNNNNVTPMHLIFKLNLWKQHYDVLKNKELDINFIDREKNTLLTYVNKQDMSMFINLIEDGIKSGLIHNLRSI